MRTSTDTHPTAASRTARRRFVVVIACALALAICLGIAVVSRSSPASPEATASESAPYDPSDLFGQLTFAVDASLQPVLTEVDGLQDGDAPRPVARMQDTDGRVSDLVLDEVLVSASDRSVVDAFAQRWNGTVVDVIGSPEPDEIGDYLVRVDPTTADVARGPNALLELEPHRPGAMRFGSERAVQLLTLAAIEASDHDLAVQPNWLAEGTTIEDGTSIEAYDIENRNAFDWSYIRNGGEVDMGIGPAWQLLESKGKLDPDSVRILVNDGGFHDNHDFPESSVLRGADWRDSNDMTCTGGALCPWHGTQVMMTAMGKLDNEYGVAGPAGPVAELVALQANPDSYKRVKWLREMVDEYRPDIVNMSYGTGVTAFRGIAEDTYNRQYGKMSDRGALLVAAAGNDGIDVDAQACIGKHCYETMLLVPCESSLVLCVGGTKSGGTWKHDGSNFGSRPGSTSVQLFAPFCVRTLADPGDPYYELETKTSCGTSHSSPLVAGIAGLLKAADPNLSPGAMRDVLLRTAHQGGVHFESVIPASGQKRVDALAAVEDVLGTQSAPPEIRIDAPTEGESFRLDHWFELEATATSFTGGALPVEWYSSLDGHLGTSDLSGDLDVPQLSEGDHVLTATTTDLAGRTSEHWAVISVRNSPPTVMVGGNLDGSEFYEGQPVELVGYTQDWDHYGPVPDGDVRWEVTKGGAWVYGTAGHNAEIPASDLSPGTYDVRFVARDAGNDYDATASFEVLAVPEGEDAPTASILSPEVGDVFGVSGAHHANVHLDGSAFDAQDGHLDGTHFRWTAESQVGTVQTLCVGSAVPGSGDGGGFLIEKDCDEIDVELDLDPAVGDIDGDGLMDPTQWTIKLTVFDSAGLYVTRSVAITVAFMEG
jgi:serine protease